MNAARHGDLLPIFGKMLENERAGGKPSVNKPSVNKPLVKQPRKFRAFEPRSRSK
jgi:hypothetical protein